MSVCYHKILIIYAPSLLLFGVFLVDRICYLGNCQTKPVGSHLSGHFKLPQKEGIY
jgi:hypothetical protein